MSLPLPRFKVLLAVIARQVFYCTGDAPLGCSECLFRTERHARTVEFEKTVG